MPDYGYAPYQESSFKSALRLLASGARGAVAAPAQGGLFGGFFTGYDASARASDAARQAAEAYNLKQREAQERRERSEFNQQYQQAVMDRMSREKEPAPTISDKRREVEDMLGRPLTDDEARRLGGVHFNPPKAASGPKAAPKSVEQRGREQITIAKQKRLAKEMQQLQSLDPKFYSDAADDPDLLPETREAVKRLMNPGVQNPFGP